MFIIGNLIKAIAAILGIGLDLYMYIIIARAIVSWVSPDPYNPIVQFLYRATEPVMSRVRRYLPTHGMGLDISPMLVLFAIIFLKIAVVDSLNILAFKLLGG